MNSLKAPIVVSISLAIASCGGGSSGGGSGSASGSFQTPTLTGVVYDREVAGLNYASENFSGQTNAQGEFKYHPEDMVTFRIGDKIVGKATARSKLTTQIIIEGIYPPERLSNSEDSEDSEDTPADPNAVFYSEEEVDRATINLVRLLMTLDSDNNPDNGINLDAQAHNAFTNSIQLLPDLTQSFIAFGEDENIQQLLASAKGITEPTLITAENARIHYGATLIREFNAQDSDGDGIPDQADQASQNAALFSDIDGDGVQDSLDWSPEDPAESADTDGDGVGDSADLFPNDAKEQIDTDNDGFGDNSDPDPNDASIGIDSDGDGFFDPSSRPRFDQENRDLFPNNPREWADSDNDSACTASSDSDSSDNPESSDSPEPTSRDITQNELGHYVLCTNGQACIDYDATSEESVDCLPGDGFGNNSDEFDRDPTEWIDEDEDGVGDNSDPRLGSTDNDYDGINYPNDTFPNDGTEFVDSDGDGVGNFSDAFPYDGNAHSDSDNDGLPDAWEARYSISTTSMLPSTDLDNDGHINIIEYQFDSDPSNPHSIPQAPLEYNTAKNNGLHFLPINSSNVGSHQIVHQSGIISDHYTDAPLIEYQAFSLKSTSNSSSLTSRIIFNNGTFSTSLLSYDPLDTNSDLYWSHLISWSTDDFPSPPSFLYSTTNKNSSQLLNIYNDYEAASPLLTSQATNSGTGVTTSVGTQDASLVPNFPEFNTSSVAGIYQKDDRALIFDKVSGQLQLFNTSDQTITDLNYDLYQPDGSEGSSYVIAATTDGAIDVVAHAIRNNALDTTPEQIYIEIFSSLNGEKFTRSEAAEVNYQPLTLTVEVDDLIEDDTGYQGFNIASDHCKFSEIYQAYVYFVCEGTAENPALAEVVKINLATLTTITMNNIELSGSSFISIGESIYSAPESDNETTYQTRVDILSDHAYVSFAPGINANNANGVQSARSHSEPDVTGFAGVTIDLDPRVDLGPIFWEDEENFTFAKGMILTPQHVIFSQPQANTTYIYDRFDGELVSWIDTAGQILASPQGNVLITRAISSDNGNDTYTNAIEVLSLNLNGDQDNDGILDIDENTHNLSLIDSLDAAQDADGDGLSNIAEINDPLYSECETIERYDPNEAEDCDTDGMPDYWEDKHGLDKFNAQDAALNNDNDGWTSGGSRVAELTNLEEYQLGLDPNTIDDTDLDQIPDHWELHYGFDNRSSVDGIADPDGDKVTNLQEYKAGTNPTSTGDQDQDGMPNHWEIVYGLNKNDSSDANTDLDLDGISNLQEFIDGTDPTVALDTDNDTMPDYWEDANGLDKNDNSDRFGDLDGDRHTNHLEYQAGTRANYFEDSDNDGLSDFWEGLYGFGDKFALHPSEDGDGDKVNNLEEFIANTNPTNYIDFDQDDMPDHWEEVYGVEEPNEDLDGDGLQNLTEFVRNSIPNDADNDGMPDHWEERHGITSPSGNPDNDGLTNLEEYQANTNPKNDDTDGDGVKDKAELNAGKDPLDSTDQDSSEDESSDDSSNS